MVRRWGLKSTNVGLWSGATIKQCTMREAPSEEVVRAAVTGHQSSLHLYNYTADEIDQCRETYEEMQSWARVLHQFGVDNLVTMSPVPNLYDDGSGHGRPAVDVWVMLPSMYEASRQRIPEVLERGGLVWSYNALVQDDYSPKWEIDFAPINFRIVPGFMSESLHLTGMLYWQVDRWTDNPWVDVITFKDAGKTYPGEGMLVYPALDSEGAGVVPSMRLKWLRDGVQDYDYLQILKQRGCSKFADSLARTVATSWRVWTKDPSVIDVQHIRIGRMIGRMAKEDIACEAGSALQ
jgi:hypothetical protein